MSISNHEHEKSPFTPAGDLLDESNLNAILLDSDEEDDDEIEIEPKEIDDIDSDESDDDEIEDRD
ncbi:MAG: hypothetical protein A2487_18165 [Candidatus Raymondbacteria bacterium RifOxyC12_full_50_8]|uniref:Uncharacterized protein n=1 Tax=Candidatus Raymondbacteria bacterium RIFOXYD12_FULL_49_13 TaxID=1817890 RepID=A0A1F7F591_UNCRA|nr:MAG: hypothetical protein A2350_19390 [Candidatus Raymondbacteria bacterium RifOxyB12_full_50_8]OGJ87189.1 MAG: hypothetical protein A2248_04115 [Candidatus Raymondbacteria bacterium RIFOXYA2_FULL_49_16]OGJ95330.1 MAG: hypothetical protein A2487_18165 [Candidatus Raymondbacteria bacterium RifOxyC12_full_50_8]OGK01809.1 MAG: hypothetical protein A2519_03010 [Candidatus Raymondbacteria bacterium RIFOXYD12_FULL_49_13]OGP41185.1 MAG: hypothetical protein A2324_08760 [Candidatus Raymondbacteria b